MEKKNSTTSMIHSGGTTTVIALLMAYLMRRIFTNLSRYVGEPREY